MKNFTRLLFLLALLVAAGSTNALKAQRVVPEEGKVYLIKAAARYKPGKWSWKEETWSYYLSAEEGNTAIKTTKDNYERDSYGNPLPKYLWRLKKDTETSPQAPYYFENCAGYGVIGRGWGYPYDGNGNLDTEHPKNNMPVVTGNYDERFFIIDFPEKYGDGEKVDGVNIKFVYGGDPNGTETRVISVSRTGLINWFNVSTMGKNNGTDYWTTNFVFEEVELKDPQKCPLTLTRTDDDAAIGKDDGDPTDTDWKHNVDYHYYATFNNSFAVRLPADIAGVYGIDESNPAEMSDYKVNLTDLISTGKLKQETGEDGRQHYVLPSLTPVLLMIKGENHVGEAQITRELVEAYDQTASPIETGFHGTTTRSPLPELHDNTCAETYYILGKENGRVSFYYLKDQVIAANKAYFVYDNKSADAASKLNIVLNAGDATSIDHAPAAPAPGSPAPIYDLTGRRVSSPVKGSLYIRGGRKFIRK